MYDLIKTSVKLGAKLYANVSGGKDGQAMTKAMHDNNLPIEGMLHCDLGRIEWPESMGMCERQAAELGLPLHIIRRKDGRGMIEHWAHRMRQLQGQGKPFWSSSAARYCTSDLKRAPTDVFYRNCGHDFIISCEGIRAAESARRAKKNPLTIRKQCSSSIYHNMTAEEAIQNFVPGKRLVLTWFPIFQFSLADVLSTYGHTITGLKMARSYYKLTGKVPEDWLFHPAYAYGNERVSCMFCVLGCNGDLANAAKQHPDILQELIGMEEESGYTFKEGFSLRELQVA